MLLMAKKRKEHLDLLNVLESMSLKKQYYEKESYLITPRRAVCDIYVETPFHQGKTGFLKKIWGLPLVLNVNNQV